MAVFCAGVMYTNYVGVNVLSPVEAVSVVNGDVYEYTSGNNSFSIFKNGELVNRIRANGNVEIKQCNTPFVGCDAVAVGVQAAQGATITAGGAASTILGSATAVGAAAVELPTAAEVALVGSLSGAMALVGVAVLGAFVLGGVAG